MLRYRSQWVGFYAGFGLPAAHENRLNLQRGLGNLPPVRATKRRLDMSLSRDRQISVKSRMSKFLRFSSAATFCSTFSEELVDKENIDLNIY